jgi:hypothetical protein
MMVEGYKNERATYWAAAKVPTLRQGVETGLPLESFAVRIGCDREKSMEGRQPA